MSAQPPDCDPAAQAQRCARLLHAVREANLPRFDSAGRWLVTDSPPGIRESMWYCLAFLAGEPEHWELANRILLNTTDDRGDFNAFTSTLLLLLHEERLSTEARQFLTQVAWDNLPHSHEHIYRYTENCSALNVFALLEGARRFDQPAWLERARERMQVYAHHRRLNGASYEFFSNNYLPVFLTGLAAVAQHSYDEEIRDLALAVEGAVWREFAAVWHPRLLMSAGPSGRSYTVDSIGRSFGLRALLWVALGDAAHPWQELGLFTPPEVPPFAESGQAWSQASATMWCATASWHVPQDVASLFTEKSYPFSMRASTHLSTWREHEEVDPQIDVRSLGGWRSVPERALLPATVLHPGGRAQLSAWLTEDWGLGASSRLVHSQTDFCRAIWRRGRHSGALPDLGALYTRYVLNDALEQAFSTEDFSGNLGEQGRGGCLQSGPLAVAWYNGGEVVTEGISRLRTCVILPEFYGPPDEIWLGEQPLPDLTGASAEQQWVFLRDGLTYLGLHPLRLTDHGRRHAVEVQELANFRAVTFCNYDGPPRAFLGAELRQTCGGLVLCVGSEREWGDFARFREACAGVEISDTRYESERDVRARWEDRSVELLWDMQTEELLRGRVDGEFLGCPHLEFS